MADQNDDQLLVTLTRGELKAIVHEALQESAALVKAPDTAVPWMDIKTVARHYGVAEGTVRNWIKSGCPARKVGPVSYRLRADEIDAWSASIEKKAG